MRRTCLGFIACNLAAATLCWSLGAGSAAAGDDNEALRDRCKAVAASRYGVEPRRVAPGAVRQSGSGFYIDATADKGDKGQEKLRCLFKADRSFHHVQAMTAED
jgi:hypothetical protein